MELAGITRIEFARRAGLSSGYVAGLLQGRPTKRQLPTVRTMQALARGLGVLEMDVVLACSRDAGMAVDPPAATDDASMSAIVACARAVTAPERARLARIAWAFSDSDRRHREGSLAAHSNAAVSDRRN